MSGMRLSIISDTVVSNLNLNMFLYPVAHHISQPIKTLCVLIHKVISKSKIKTDGRHHGPHSLRHSLASCLLKNEVPIPVISEVLGHTKTDTTMIYLRIDLGSLTKCSLPV